MRAAIAACWVLLTMTAVEARAADYVQMSGQEQYQRFCAACHGVEGRGDGPVAASFVTEMPDLTLITRRAGGTYPRERVERIIDGRFIIGAHGSRTMPVWGEDLSRLEIGNPDAERMTRTVIGRIADYVRELQRGEPLSASAGNAAGREVLHGLLPDLYGWHSD